MAEEYLFLTLGCFGRRDGNFTSCRSVENRILLISTELQYYNEMMDYFESVRLFDRPIFDLNAIRHVIFYIQDKFTQDYKPIWEVNRFRLFEKFILDHKLCGTYLKLLVTDQFEEEDVLLSDAVPILIKAQK